MLKRVLSVTTALVAAGAIATGHVIGAATQPATFYAFSAVAAPSYTVLGVTIRRRVPDNRIGTLFLAIGLSSVATVLAASYSRHPLMAWIGQWSLLAGLGLIPLVLLNFPDGQLPSSRWRPVSWAAVFGLVITTAALAVATALAPRSLLDLGAPVSATTEAAFLIAAAGAAILVAAAAAAVLALVVRWRRSTGDTRLQIEALLGGAVAIPVGAVLDFFVGLPGLWLALGLALPAAITPAILKYRLYDIDLIVNRSLVYCTLVLLVIVGYVAVVTVVAPALGTPGDGLSPIVATAVVAVLFQPARARVQRRVDRLLYGERNDPYAVITRLRRDVEQVADPGGALPEIVRSLTETLRLPYAAIELADAGATEPSGRPVASYGRPGIEPLAFPMIYLRQQVGWLLVSPRAAGASFTRKERQLFHQLAAQAGMAGYALRLTTALRTSRERLVRSREEERRRIRRELHDGLGPALAGMTMHIGAARAVTPEGARGSLDDMFGMLEQQLQSCVGEIRRLVEDLRPAALDELGLGGALRSRAEVFAVPGRSGPQITVRADNLGEMPAAVEVAAYRIATEAMTNAVRHANARRCDVALTANGVLNIEINDDGTGLPDGVEPGVGLSSMRERAEELGGSLTTIRAAGGGTRVRATIPLDAP